MSLLVTFCGNRHLLGIVCSLTGELKALVLKLLNTLKTDTFECSHILKVKASAVSF